MTTEDNLIGIKNFTNLEILEIARENVNELDKTQEYSFIKSLKNLKSIKLIASNTSYIDLSNNKKLKNINIYAKTEELQIDGLLELDCFTKNKGKVNMSVIGNVSNMYEIISQCNKKNTRHMTLDLLHFAKVAHEKPKLIEMLREKKK